MPDQGDVNGWAPLDPGLTDGSRHTTDPEPRPPEAQPSWPEQPYGQPQGPQGPQGYGPPQPYAQPYGQPQPYEQPQPQAYGQPQPYGPPQPHGPGYGAYQQPYGYGTYPPQPFTGYGPRQPRGPWSVAPPPGTPFHRMARTAVHRWWRPLVGTVSVAVVSMLLMVAMMLIGVIVQAVVTGGDPFPSGTDDDAVFSNDTADLAFNLAAIAIFLPVVLLAAWAVQRRRPGTLSSVAGRLRWRWLLACSGLAVAFCVVSYGTSIVAAQFVHDSSSSPEHWVGWDRFIPPAIVILLLVPLQSSAEEFLFRGWLLQAVGSCTLEDRTGRVGRAASAVLRTPWPGIVIGSALFTAGHGYTGWGILDIFFFGAVAAWLATRTGGLESGIALHVFNNLLAFLGPAAVGQLDIEEGGVPWQYVAADIVPMALYAAAVVWLARRRRIQTVTAAPADDPGADAPPRDAEPEFASRPQ